MKPYDRQTKVGNEGDVVKHPALIAAINGLLAEHDRLFRYYDAFAGRWEYELRKGGAWTRGIERFASGCAGGKPDVELWRRQWTEWRPDLLFLDAPCLRNAQKRDYPTLGSLLQLAQGIENGLMWLPMAGEVGPCGTHQTNRSS